MVSLHVTADACSDVSDFGTRGLNCPTTFTQTRIMPTRDTPIDVESFIVVFVPCNQLMCGRLLAFNATHRWSGMHAGWISINCQADLRGLHAAKQTAPGHGDELVEQRGRPRAGANRRLRRRACMFTESDQQEANNCLKKEKKIDDNTDIAKKASDR